MNQGGAQSVRPAGCERPEGALARLLADRLERPVLSDHAAMRDRQLLIARLTLHLGHWCDAEAYYKCLLDDGEADATVWAEAAALADAMGEVACAAKRYRRAFELRHDGAEEEKTQAVGFLRSLAIVHMHGGRFDQAGWCWWRLTRAEVDPAEAWAGLWVCAWVEARAAVTARAESMLRRHTPRAVRRVLLAEMWQHAATQVVVHTPRPALGETDGRSPLRELVRCNARVLRAAAREHPMRADVHYHLARLEDAVGDVATARREVREALFINPRYVAAHALALRVAA